MQRSSELRLDLQEGVGKLCFGKLRQGSDKVPGSKPEEEGIRVKGFFDISISVSTEATSREAPTGPCRHRRLCQSRIVCESI